MTMAYTTTLIDVDIARMVRVKRFLECFRADANLREQLSTDPSSVHLAHDLDLDLEDLRPIWDPNFVEQHAPQIPISKLLADYQTFADQRLTWSDLRDIGDRSANMAYHHWRQRQIRRCDSELGPSFNGNIVHSPAVFELSKGCSVGCWFCGISAPKLGDIFRDTSDNRSLWQETLDTLKGVLGPAATAGFCYWATDPLDNPDYEVFCLEYANQMGLFPQTTTAQPLRDPDRMRRLLKLSQERGCKVNRFSILSLKILERVHAEYTPDELAQVELVLQMPHTDVAKAKAGRSLETMTAKPDQVKDHHFLPGGTIACVSGFLFNMVERSVQLITPCNASVRWPLGYQILATGSFSCGDDLGEVLQRMIEQQMPTEIRPEHRLRFREDLAFEPLPDGFGLNSRYLKRKFTGDPVLTSIAQQIVTGKQTAGEIAKRFWPIGIPHSLIQDLFNRLLNKGVLDEEVLTDRP